MIVARFQHQFRWLLKLHATYVIPADLLSLGFRWMHLGLRVSLIVFPLAVISLTLSQQWHADPSFLLMLENLFLAVHTGALVVVFAGKLMSLFAPVGKGFVGAYWVGLLLAVAWFLLCPKDEMPVLACLVVHALFLAFLFRLSEHFRWSSTRRYLKLTSLGYAASATLALLGMAFSAAGAKEPGESLCLAALLVYYLASWSYARCLGQASGALRAGAGPVRMWAYLWALLKALVEQARNSGCCKRSVTVSVSRRRSWETQEGERSPPPGHQSLSDA